MPRGRWSRRRCSPRRCSELERTRRRRGGRGGAGDRHDQAGRRRRAQRSSGRSTARGCGLCRPRRCSAAPRSSARWPRRRSCWRPPRDDAWLIEQPGRYRRGVAGVARELQDHDAARPAASPSCCCAADAAQPVVSVATGLGYDCHRLVEGRPLIIGGVKIPHTHGLLGHSDADVLTHAIIDALLGAAGARRHRRALPRYRRALPRRRLARAAAGRPSRCSASAAARSSTSTRRS